MRYSLLLIAFVTVLAGCKKPGTESNENVDLTNGTWRISYFWDVTDKTSTYNGYYFMFQSDGSFMAHSNTNMIVGTWGQTGTRININFSGAPMSDLSGDWLKTEFANNSVKLKDDSPSQDDQLHFIKN